MMLGNGLIPQAFAWGGVAPLPLFGTDRLAAAAVAAEGFDAAEPWWAMGMQNLEDQFVR